MLLLLTESFSDDSSMSVSANIITLKAGTYLVKADANIAMDNNNSNNFVQGAIVDTGDSDSVLIAGKLLHNYNDFSDDTTHDFSCIVNLSGAINWQTTVALKFRTIQSAGTSSRIEMILVLLLEWVHQYTQQFISKNSDRKVR